MARESRTSSSAVRRSWAGHGLEVHADAVGQWCRDLAPLGHAAPPLGEAKRYHGRLSPATGIPRCPVALTRIGVFPRESRHQMAPTAGLSTVGPTSVSPGRAATWRRSSVPGVDDLAARITGCRACPRLVSWREQVAGDKRPAFAEETYWGQAGAGVRRPGGAAGGSRAGPCRSRGQPHRAHVHRRPLRRLALPGAASRRVCQPGGVIPPRRRTVAARLLGDGGGAVCPARQSPRARRSASCLPSLAGRGVPPGAGPGVVCLGAVRVRRRCCDLLAAARAWRCPAAPAPLRPRTARRHRRARW